MSSIQYMRGKRHERKFPLLNAFWSWAKCLHTVFIELVVIDCSVTESPVKWKLKEICQLKAMTALFWWRMHSPNLHQALSPWRLHWNPRPSLVCIHNKRFFFVLFFITVYIMTVMNIVVSDIHVSKNLFHRLISRERWCLCKGEPPSWPLNFCTNWTS